MPDTESLKAEFSGIRATPRLARAVRAAPASPTVASRSVRAAAAFLILAGTLAGLAAALAPAPAFANGGGHDAPPAAEPAKKEEEKPPPPPPKPSYKNMPRITEPPVEEKPRALGFGEFRFVADPYTGLALGGYDPVGYFISGEPTEGNDHFQYDWAGTTWVFANEGNLAAFRDAPSIYAPAFGGRCAYSIANGRPTEGDPRFFIIFRGRLLLFANAENGEAFKGSPGQFLSMADEKWKILSHNLP